MCVRERDRETKGVEERVDGMLISLTGGLCASGLDGFYGQEGEKCLDLVMTSFLSSFLPCLLPCFFQSINHKPLPP